MAYHVNEKQEIKPCGTDLSNPNSTGCKFGLPADRHFPTQALAVEFTEEQETKQRGLFPVNKATQPPLRNYRSVKNPEPPVITDDRFWDNDPENDEIKERSFVSHMDDPNNRHHDDPDARYIGAQLRSRRQSYSPGERHMSSVPISKEVISNGKKYDFSIDSDNLLHNFNKPSYVDSEISVFFHKGVIHREPEDGPALTFAHGKGEIYMYHGLYHNPNGPAVIMEDRTERWVHGLLHCTGAPAVIHSNGTKEYWERGEHIRTEVPEVKETPEALRRKRERVYNDPDALELAAVEANSFAQQE